MRPLTHLEPVADAEAAANLISNLEQAAWGLAALIQLAQSKALTDSALVPNCPGDEAAARILVACGLAIAKDDRFVLAEGMADLQSTVPVAGRLPMITSTLRQVAAASGILPAAGGAKWAANDDETLLAQGRGSAIAGRMLAQIGVVQLDGLAERFDAGGRFLDVGTGVGEIGAAFADSVPGAFVVGIDVLPRAVDLARALIAERTLEDRFEVRLQGVEDLDDEEQFDLAWLPAPFIPRSVFTAGIAAVRTALRPGGWLVVAAGHFEGDPLAVAVTRWQTLRAGGTPLTSADARLEMEAAGLVDFMVLPTPPGAPALYVARRPRHASPGPA